MTGHLDDSTVHHVDPAKRFELESPPDDTEEESGGRWSPSLLWAGGAAVALVSGLLAVVGILVARGLLDVAVLAPRGEGAWGDASTFAYAAAAALCAFAATGLLHLLLSAVPDAVRFFTWISLLLTAIATVLPLSLDIDTPSQVATAVLNTVIGVAIVVSLRDVARRSGA
ncbi:DUF6069 family protein [Saccharothrix longispora]|uniref:DUF6069 family protein n=1 Tax=Saccharothrix longispora TaxID=33920 RepID=UPI0028FCFB55|nr:DUF6069 family protein [Saccharothrix longispora]MDU0292336.1 DUF6069 family protein [Saccharothrix longispora]